MWVGVLLSGYFLATLWEHYLHKQVLHASAKRTKRWKESSFSFYRLLYKGYYSHHVVHHKLTFQQHYHLQFNSQKEQEKLDNFLIKKFGETESKQNYGLTINTLYEYAMFILPAFFLLPILAFFLEFYQLVIFTVPLVLPLLLSKYIHPILHDNLENKSWVYNNFYTRKIYETHYIHHLDDSKNFNLLLGGDWVMGTCGKGREREPNNRL